MRLASETLIFGGGGRPFLPITSTLQSPAALQPRSPSALLALYIYMYMPPPRGLKVLAFRVPIRTACSWPPPYPYRWSIILVRVKNCRHPGSKPGESTLDIRRYPILFFYKKLGIYSLFFIFIIF